MKHKRKHKSTFEMLETRQMMSATVIGSASLSLGTLTVNGDATQPTNMVLDYSPDRSRIEVHTGSLNTSYLASEVTNLVINGGSGNDNIFVSNRITLPSNINGGAGDDVIHGGGGNDIIHGGAGNDLIYGGRGSNQIYGDAGNDTLMGQSKNDSLYAGSGNDFLYGGSGDDYMVAGPGNDTMIGGAGNDTLVGGSGIDVEMGGSGNDTLTGNSASTLMGDSGKNTINGVVGATSTGATASVNAGNSTTSTDTGTTPVTTAPTTPVTTKTTAPVTTAPTPPVTTAPVTPVTTTPTTPVVTTPTNSTLSAKITTLDGIRQTGLSVNVNALDSSFGTGTALTAKYSWNFGDTGSYGNTLVGWNAAHVYDTPGTYTLSLTITTPDGKTSSTSEQMTIAASTRKLIYVDSVAGSDSNTGSANAPLQSLAAAFTNLGNNTEILLKAGETFDVTSSLHINNSNIVVGKYGSGADPVMNRINGGGVSTINIWYTSASITVQNITMDSPNAVAENAEAPKIGVSGVYAGGTNVTVRDCTFLNVDDAVNCNGSPTGILVQNNTAPLKTGVRGYFFWGQGSSAVVDGNVVANSTREHNIRMVGVDMVTVENNNLTNLSRATVDPSDFSKGCIEEHRGEYAYITNNTVTDGDIRVGPLGLWGEPLTTTTENCVIVDNTLNDTQVSVDVGAHHILIENNVVDGDNEAAIVVQGAGNTGRIVDDITITHNTVVNDGTQGQFIEVLGTATNLVLTNNLWVAPNIEPGAYNTAAVYSATPDLSEFSNIADNVWAAPTHATTYADGGINLVTGAATPTGYLTGAEWNAYPQVHNDQVANVTLADTYEVSLNNILAGSTMNRAA